MIKKITTILAAALAVAACGPKEAVTTLTGKFGDEAPAEVYVYAAGIDTVVTVTKSGFSLSVPVDLAQIGSVKSEDVELLFISDGSKLTFDFSGETPTVTSNNPKSVTSRMNAFFEENRERTMAVRAEQDEEKSEELYKAYVDFNKETVAANLDNYLGIFALRNVYHEYEPDELIDVLEGLSPELQHLDFVDDLAETARAQVATGEGAMFTDFEVEEEPGRIARLSDYVGKGKYVLVDFWASWCGPCKREMPYIAAAYEKYHGEKFDVLSVAVWDEAEDTKKAAPGLGIVWNQIVNAQKIPTDLYGIQGIPHLILFGPDGTILKRGLRGDGIQEELAKYLD